MLDIGPTAKDESIPQNQYHTNPFKTAPSHLYNKARPPFPDQHKQAYEDMSSFVNPVKTSPSGKPTQMFQNFVGVDNCQNYYPMDKKNSGGDVKLHDFISQYGTNEPIQSEEGKS